MSEQERKAIVKCTFCGKPLSKDEVVRYRGAVACSECAAKAEAEQERFTSPAFFFVGGIGAVLAAVGSFGYIPARLLPLPQWVIIGFTLIPVGLGLITIGDLGLYFNWDRKWGFILAALSLAGCFGGLVYVQNYLSLGPMIYLDEIPATYMLSLYIFEGGLYIMLALNGALMVLTRDDHGIELLTLATAGAMLLASAILYVLLPAFTLLAMYFLTAKPISISA